MTIRSTSFLVAIGSLVILIVNGIIWWNVNDSIQRSLHTSDIAEQVVFNVAYLTIYTNDILLGKRQRSIEQWQQTYSGLQKIIAQSDQGFKQGALLKSLQMPLNSTKTLFERWVALDNHKLAGLGNAEQDLESDLVEQLLVEIQAITTQARHIFQESQQAISESRQQEKVIGTIVFGWAAVLSFGVILFLFRRVIYPLNRLQEGTQAIKQGNFATLVATKHQDEIGRLSQHFNDMTQSLKESYDSLEEEIKQRRQAENALREREERLSAIVDTVEDGIITIDEHGNIQTFNKSAEKIFGYAAKELMGKNVNLLMPAPYQQEHDEYITHYLKTREKRVIGIGRELEGLKKDRTQFPMHLTVGETWIGGEHIFMGIVHDLTESKRIQKELTAAKELAERANQAKSQFLSSISHEIRTPLNAITGMMEILESTPLSKNQIQYVESVDRAVETLLSLINDVLDLAKIEAQQLEIEQAPFDLEQLIDGLLEIVAFRANKHGLEMLHCVPLEVPTHLIGDATRLRQILLNLLSNAVKFTPNGTVMLDIEVASQDAQGCVLQFIVQDTGIGIPQKKIDTVFHDFIQGDSSITRQYGGTGLGLSISKRLVELMGGDIGMESSVGVGSTFWCKIPFVIDSHPPAKEALPPLQLNGMKVLVVDDHPVNRQILTDILAKHGAYPREAASGGAALDEIFQARKTGHPYELLVIDTQMPGMNGWDVVHRLNDRNEFPLPAVFLLTSGNKLDDEQKSKDLGVTARLLKPIRRKKLIETLHDVFFQSNDLAEPPAEAKQAVASLEPGRQNAYRVLLVEDDETNRDIFLKHLWGEGYTVHIAENGKKAVEQFKRETYDLILMDLQMPIMDGYEATQQIRKWESDQHHSRTPIIALTAFSLKGDLEKVLKSGCDEYLLKPLKKKTLINKIESFLGTAPQAGPATVPVKEALQADESPYITWVDPDFRDLVPVVLERRKKQTDEMKQALATTDFDTIRKVNHKLKSSPGLNFLNKMGARIEQAAIDNDSDTIRRSIDQLLDYFENVEIRVKSNDD